jgi:hypothetical protein
MPVKDELARRRHEKLVDPLESLIRDALRPEYQGYYGQLMLSGDDLTEMGELKDIRRAAREAGRRLGWKTTTQLAGGRLFVLDEREVPEEIEEPAGMRLLLRLTGPGRMAVGRAGDLIQGRRKGQPTPAVRWAAPSVTAPRHGSGTHHAAS